MKVVCLFLLRKVSCERIYWKTVKQIIFDFKMLQKIFKRKTGLHQTRNYFSEPKVPLSQNLNRQKSDCCYFICFLVYVSIFKQTVIVLCKETKLFWKRCLVDADAIWFRFWYHVYRFLFHVWDSLTFPLYAIFIFSPNVLSFYT